MKSAGKARSNGLYRHIRTSKEIIRNLLNDYIKIANDKSQYGLINTEDCELYNNRLIPLITTGLQRGHGRFQGGSLHQHIICVVSGEGKKANSGVCKHACNAGKNSS